MKKVVFGLANSPTDAERIVSALQRAGFRNNEISVLLSEAEEDTHFRDRDEFGEIEGFSTTSHKKGSQGHGKHTRGSSGDTFTGAIGRLQGVGSLAIPELGVFVAAGPIVSFLSNGTGTGGVGLLQASLVGMGLPESEATRFETSLRNGGVFICIHARSPDHIETAKDVLKKENARDITTSRDKAGSRR